MMMMSQWRVGSYRQRMSRILVILQKQKKIQGGKISIDPN